MKIVATLLSGMMFIAHTHAADLLQVKTEVTTTVLGEPVQLQVRYHAATPSLADLQLNALRQDFFVDEAVYETHWEVAGDGVVPVQTLSASLYPLRAGMIRIPSLELQGRRSNALNIKVLPMVDRGDFRVVTGVKAGPLRERQPAYVYLDVEDNGSVVDVAPVIPTGNAIHAQALGLTEKIEQRGGKQVTIRRYAWAITPLRAGRISVSFPMVRIRMLRRGGGIVLRVPPPPVLLQAESLPGYLPIEVPVGTVVAKSELMQYRNVDRYWAGETYTWRILLSGIGLNLEGVRTLVAPQLVDSPRFRFYPPEFNQHTAVSDDPLLQEVEVIIPFETRQAGTHSLPILKLPYVNEKTGRLLTVVVAQEIDVSRRWVHRLFQAMAIFFILGAVAGLFYFIYRHVRKWHIRRRLRHELLRANNQYELKAALFRFARVSTGHDPLTLKQWLDVTTLDGSWQQIVDTLQRACYGRETSMVLPDLRTEIIHAAARIK